MLVAGPASLLYLRNKDGADRLYLRDRNGVLLPLEQKTEQIEVDSMRYEQQNKA